MNKAKSLGVIIDQGLNWEDQFKAIKAKVRGGLASLKTLKNIVSQSQLSNVYRALVESHIRTLMLYGVVYPTPKWNHYSVFKTGPFR